MNNYSNRKDTDQENEGGGREGRMRDEKRKRGEGKEE